MTIFLVTHLNNIIMAEENKPLVELTKEALKQIDGMKVDIDAVDSNLNAFEKLGIDVSKMRERTAWAKKAREIILKEIK